FQRWLSQQLAIVGDQPGICAGVDFTSLPALERRLAGPDDPWRPERLAWLVQRVAAGADDPALAVLQAHLAASREGFTASLRIARQFSGYARFRPSMLVAWSTGADTDADGLPLGANTWQAHLWRLLAAELGENPLQRRAALLERLEAGPVPGLARRVAVLAPGRLDEAALDLFRVLDRHHRIDLLPLTPAPTRPGVAAGTGLRRAEVSRLPGHPLNESLAVVADEAARLLPSAPSDAEPTSPETVLGWLQSDLRADRQPVRRLLEADDSSIRVHLSHGRDRQVEVLREVLTGLLAADPTLEPRDLVVLTPDVDAFAPLVGAAFTPPAGAATHPAQRFRVQVADRSVAQVNPMVTLLLDLLRLPDGRIEASTLLELCARPGIAKRFGFAAESRERLVDLVDRSGIRWGLSQAHREGYGLKGFPQNAWFAGLQRMLLGVTLAETDLVSAGTVLPLDDVESSDVELVGGLTELVGRLARLVAELGRPATLADWAERCRTGLASLVQLPFDSEWQLGDVWAGLARLAEHGGEAGDTLVGRHAAVRAIEQEFSSSPARGAFGNGSLVVAGLSSVRQVPHRVVVLLGWDADCYPRSGRRHGDDLLGAEPRVGDPSVALDDRQVLLDAILAAREKLVIVAQGRSEATNEPVPLAAPLAELLEALDETAEAPDGTRAGAAITVQHPLQPFDTRYFDPAHPELASADPLAHRAALASLDEPVVPAVSSPLGPLPAKDLLPGISLDELTGYFGHPARALLRGRTGISLGDEQTSGDSIPIEPDHLERWQIGNRILGRLRAGQDEDAVKRAEWLRGDVPPFELGNTLLDGVLTEARRSVREVPADLPEAHLHDIALSVPVPGHGQVPLVGRVASYGTELLQVEFSSLQPRHRLIAWLRLLALSAAVPGDWQARVVGKGRRTMLVAPPQEVARGLLGRYLAVYALGMSQPLPALPRIGAAWAGYRVSHRDPGDPLVSRKNLDRCWEWESDDYWRTFFAFPALLDLPAAGVAIPDADPRERTLVGALATCIWEPLLAAEVPA
ncbi:MAG TPA: exodeoxyribonuclease V subunit gamma, partial [Propionicimonas sp.]|nr:exodeoxyribonuclease V subunit gamma [Propionicimonas sp.]